jgi:hypothetical protein
VQKKSILIKKVISNSSNLCLFLFFLISSLLAEAQPTVTKQLPQPKFFVLGLSNDNFPKLNGSWEDTLELIQYGKEIDLWLRANSEKIELLKRLKNNTSANQINTDFFKSLNNLQTLKFKEIANKLSYVIVGQKKFLLNEYFSKNKNQKSKIDFYNEVEQIYFINQKDLDFLFNQIKS